MDTDAGARGDEVEELPSREELERLMLEAARRLGSLLPWAVDTAY
jgi:hypothetical protein